MVFRKLLKGGDYMFTVVWSRQGNPLRAKVFRTEAEAQEFIEDILKAEYLDIILLQGMIMEFYRS